MSCHRSETLATRCPACDGSSATLTDRTRDYLTRESFDLLRCEECGLVSTRIPEQYESADAYGEEYYNQAGGKFVAGVESLFQWAHRRRARQLWRQLGPESVLEVGCGRGELLHALQSLGVRVGGLESPDAPCWILQNPHVDVRPFEADQPHPFGDQTFDLVLIWHVLEHLEEPVQVLRDCARLLSSGGRLLVSVPNRRSLQAGLRLRTWFHLDAPRHLYHFDRQDLSRVLERSGFHVIRFERGDLLQDLYGAWQSVANLVGVGRHNVLYWSLHGGAFWRRPSDLLGLLWQLLLSPLWITAGSILFALEIATGRGGTITVVADLVSAVEQ